MNATTVLAPKLYEFLAIAFWFTLITSAVFLLMNLVFLILELRARRKKERNPKQRLLVDSLKGLGRSSLICAFFFAMGGSGVLWLALSGEDHAQAQLKDERVAAELVDSSSRYFLQELSDQQIEDFMAYEEVELEVATAEGYLENRPFSLYMDKTIIDATTGSPWSTSVEEQRSWLLRGSVRDLALDRYGLVLSDDQLNQLAIPASEPSALTRYGSIPIAISAENGGYYNLDATLIWDGEFKLVGFPESGGDELQELPRR